MQQKQPSPLVQKIRRMADIFNNAAAGIEHQQIKTPFEDKEQQNYTDKNNYVQGGSTSVGNSNINNNSNNNSNTNNGSAVQGGAGGNASSGGNGGNSTAIGGTSTGMPGAQTSSPSETLLREASRNPCSIARMRNAIAQGAELDAATSNGKTPLIHAVINNNEAAVAILIEAGANIGKRDTSGRSAKDYAAGKPVGAALEKAIDASIKSQMTLDAATAAPVARLKIGRKKDDRKQGA